MDKKRVLWADDEIDLLKPHIIFLEQRGYEVTPVANGEDAISLVQNEFFDIVLLDEMMPGLDGLSTLSQIKDISPNLPVIMITKSEEERLMEEAIGQRIDDYLTKPVNPSQILSACKRILEMGHIQKDRMGRDYATEFNRSRSIIPGAGWREWTDLHVRLSEWDLRIEELLDGELRRMHEDHKRECNQEFAKHIERSYRGWLEEDDPPILSVDMISEFVYPHLRAGRQVFFIVVDCMRLDHWLAIEPLLSELYRIRRSYHYSILPTATPYARNAIFSGLFPSEIAGMYPEVWRAGQEDERSRNRYEHQLLDSQLESMGLHLQPESKYIKVIDAAEGSSLARRVSSFHSVPLVSIVFNFLDILAHGRSESEILQEIAPDEAAFRSLTTSWFSHSSLFEMLKRLARTDAVIVLTSDHGTVLGTRSALVHGDRDTSTNLRYKYGKNLRCDPKQAMLIREPEAYKLPSFGMGANFLVAKEDYYFVYPTRFHEYRRQYRNSFQHGGISLEEMILPVVVMRPR